jgi:hypothetical protein
METTLNRGSGSSIQASPRRRGAVRAAASLWLAALGVVVTGHLALRASEAGTTLDGLIATRTGMQLASVLSELKSGTGSGLGTYFDKRGTGPLTRSLGFRKARLERTCQRGAGNAASCVEGMRELVQQLREVERLERVSARGGEEGAKARVRLAGAVYFQQVREEVLPEFARKNRNLFTRKGRAPASAGVGSPATQFEGLSEAMAGTTRAVLGAGSDYTSQVENLEQAYRDFGRTP